MKFLEALDGTVLHMKNGEPIPLGEADPGELSESMYSVYFGRSSQQFRASMEGVLPDNELDLAVSRYEAELQKANKE